jgi:hypothetical protein
MPKSAVGALPLLLVALVAHGQTTARSPGAGSPDVANMPSEAEIGELLSKASEYVETYKQTFAAAKGSLEKASQPGFYDRAATMCAQASQVIAAIKKNGSTAVALVSLIAVLDDMSLNGARASASTLLLAVEDKRAMQDFQNLAQAEKNCYDISELLLHATIRYISAEEAPLRALLELQKK